MTKIKIVYYNIIEYTAATTFINRHLVFFYNLHFKFSNRFKYFKWRTGPNGYCGYTYSFITLTLIRA